MTAARTRPASGRIRARIARSVNVPVRAILGLPFPTPLGWRPMLLFITGRKTGKTYRLPVSYVPVRGAAFPRLVKSCTSR